MSIRCVEVHNYAPELNKIHMVDGTVISAPQVKTFEEAERFLRGRR